MIRKYTAVDLQCFEPNEFSGIERILPLFLDGRYHKYTLWDGELAKAIIYFIPSAPTEWAGFFLVSKYFTARNGLELKDFIKQTCEKYKPTRLWTVSLDCPLIEKWHRFLKLKKEKDGKLQYNGLNYVTWSKRWNR